MKKILNIILLIACIAVFVAVVAFSVRHKDFPTPSGSIYTEPTIYQESVR